MTGFPSAAPRRVTTSTAAAFISVRYASARDISSRSAPRRFLSERFPEAATTSQLLDLSDRTRPEDRGDHDQIGTHFADCRDEAADLLTVCHWVLAHGEEDQI